MRLGLHFIASLAMVLATGCVSHHYHGPGTTTRQQPVTVVEYRYGGTHPIDTGYGGGWCASDGMHVHDYAPEYPQYYRVSNNVYYYDDYPAAQEGSRPAGYRPPSRGDGAKVPPGQAQNPPGHSDDHRSPPGLGRTPPGHGGTPPGHAKTPPGQNKTPPGLSRTPPGHGGTPPGHAKTPPGHAKTPPGRDGTPPGLGNRTPPAKANNPGNGNASENSKRPAFGGRATPSRPSQKVTPKSPGKPAFGPVRPASGKPNPGSRPSGNSNGNANNGNANNGNSDNGNSADDKKDDGNGNSASEDKRSPSKPAIPGRPATPGKPGGR